MIEYLLVAVVAVGNLGDYDVRVVERYASQTACRRALVAQGSNLKWPQVRLLCLAKDYN